LSIVGAGFRRVASLVALCFLCCNAASATAINFTVSNIAGNTWQYSYVVSGHTFLTDETFEILFDENLYTNLQDPPPAVAGWMLLVFQPEVPPNPNLPGIYSATAQSDGAPLGSPFVIQFEWLGIGTPGSQPFNVYDSSFNLIDSGQTVAGNPIPEPGSVVLLTSALLAWMAVRRYRRGKPAV